ELGEAEPFRALDDQRVGARDVEPRLDDRGRHQYLIASAQEPEHRPLEGRRLHLTVYDGDARGRDERPNLLGRLVDRLDAVVQVEDLAAALELALDRPAHEVVVVVADIGVDRATALGRGLDHRDVAKAGERHLERARNRRRG